MNEYLIYYNEVSGDEPYIWYFIAVENTITEAIKKFKDNCCPDEGVIIQIIAKDKLH